MGKIFVTKQADFQPAKNKTLRALLTEADFAGLTYDELVLYNWGTKERSEVNRALVELVGCSQVADDPQDSKLDPALGTKKTILIPKPYTCALTADQLKKTHVIKVKRRLPVPAVSITKLTSWFVPKTGPDQCEIDYVLEGVSSRADKVDFEVHATNYFAIDKGGAQSPSDTSGEKDSTHIFRRVAKFRIDDPVGQPRPPVPPKITWNGESEATKGVLKKEQGQEAYITHACAPYTVSLRYYKDDADKNAKLTLEPFLPRWKAPPNQAALEDDSLVVKWAIKNDNNKLKLGQLLLFNKAGVIVFRAALDEVKLRGGKYDLVNDPVKPWPKVQIRAAEMPYRVQIQAHSDEDEDNGLALAAMPTVVRTFQYTQIQFIAFNIKPGTRITGTGKATKVEYLGDADHDADIATRCDIMKDAVRTAYATADANEHTLKIFMAPEFYFRGRDGAYPVEKLSTIPPIMREETDQFKYVDWLFVLGSAIGYLDHEQFKKDGSGKNKATRHEGEAKHNIEIENPASGPKAIEIESKLAKPEVKWKIVQGSRSYAVTAVASGATDKYTVTLAKTSGLALGPAYLVEPVAVVLDTKTEVGGIKKIKVRSKLCSRIPQTTGDKAIRWLADQGWFTQSAITECVHDVDDVYWLTLSNKKSFNKNKAITLIEPVATEVLNVAQVQRGWPSPVLHHGLTQALVDKETISSIDYLGKNSQNLQDWFAPHGLGRVIDIHGRKNRTVLPREGAEGLLGASPSKPGGGGAVWVDKQGLSHTVGSEINVSGIGGGSVFTMDGITFGLEVCLDHMYNRLHEFYQPGKAAAGDPKVQVLLIPSWGMSIGGGELVCPRDAAHPGLVFNVDGSRWASDARANDGTFSCDDHPARNAAIAGPCQEPVHHYVCPTCNSIRGDEPGTCDDGHPALALLDYYQCASPKRFYSCATCNAIVSDTPGNCPTHPLVLLVEFWFCTTCGYYYPAGGGCGCAPPTPQICEAYYPAGGQCSQPPSAPMPHGKTLQPLGTEIATVGPAVDVPSADAPNYFQKKGQVLIYTVQPLPPPAVVP